MRYCGDDVVFAPRPGTSTFLPFDGLSAGDPLCGPAFPLADEESDRGR